MWRNASTASAARRPAGTAPVRVEGGEDGVVAAGVGDDRHADAWFLAAARTIDGPADVDLLDQAVEVELAAQGALGGGRERVEVDDDELEGLDAGRGELLAVGGQAAVGQDPAVDPRVERLHPAVEHLREAGDGGDVGDGEAGLAQRARRAAGADELEAAGDEAGGEGRRGRPCRRRRGAPGAARASPRRRAAASIVTRRPSTRSAPAEQQPDGPRQEPVLDRVEALQERLLGVAGEDRDGLGERRSGRRRAIASTRWTVTPGDRRARRERVADRVRARERRAAARGGR